MESEKEICRIGYQKLRKSTEMSETEYIIHYSIRFFKTHSLLVPVRAVARNRGREGRVLVRERRRALRRGLWCEELYSSADEVS